MQQVVTSADTPRRTRHFGTAACTAAAMVLVAVAFALPQWRGQQWSRQLYAAAAPIFGIWGPHIGWGTGPAIAIAVLVVVLGPQAARRLSWGRLLTVAWLTSVAWTFALAMIDGWQVGFAGRLTRQHEYLWEVGGVRDIGVMLRGFSSRILDFRPDSWTTHVAGHPPGALLTFVLLDRIGLRGGAWAAWLCVLVGGSAVAAVAVALDALGAADRARAVLPLLVLAPAAVWVGVSADGFFAGVTAWAVALLAVATRQRAGWPGVALASGLLFGYGLYLNYGLTCMAIPAAAVLLARGFRPMLPALLGVALVAGAFTAAGFSWLDGYHLVVQRYYQGIASERPYSYWVWGNLAATVCAVGLATTAALPEVVRGLSLPALRWWRTGTAEPPDRQPGTGIAAALGPQRAREIPAAADRLRVADIAAAPGSPPVVGIAEPSRRGQGGGFAEALGRWRAVVDPAALLAAAGLVAIAAADLSGLSKAETERIWLPFDVWLLAATALLPRRAARWWLVTQAVAALLLNHLLATNW